MHGITNDHHKTYKREIVFQAIVSFLNVLFLNKETERDFFLVNGHQNNFI